MVGTRSRAMRSKMSDFGFSSRHAAHSDRADTRFRAPGAVACLHRRVSDRQRSDAAGSASPSFSLEDGFSAESDVPAVAEAALPGQCVGGRYGTGFAATCLPLMLAS